MSSWRAHQLKHKRVILENDAPGFVPGEYYWPVDFSVRSPGYGTPPDGHHRRCQSFKKQALPKIIQCGRWARPGKRVCIKHNGGKSFVNRRNSYYEKRGGPRLRQILEAGREGTPEEQLSLLDELAIARGLAGDTMDKWEAAHEQGSDELIRKADAAMRAVVDHICTVAEKASKVRVQSQSVVAAEHIDYILHHVGRIIEAHVDAETAKKIVDEVSSIPLPTAANSNQTPSEFVEGVRTKISEMDDLVTATETVD